MSALLYVGAVTVEQKRAWVTAVVAAAAYVIYVVLVLTDAGPGPITAVPYAAPLLWTVGSAIVATIVGNIAAAALTPPEDAVADVRDAEIARLGDQVGSAFIVLGGLAALVLALVEAPHFWIANAVYLAFVLSAVLGSLARLGAYHRGL